MVNYLTPNIVVEVFCLIIAFRCLYGDESLAWKSMIVFMLLTCGAELCGIATRTDDSCNNLVYNLFLIAEFGFVTAMYGYFINTYTNNINAIYAALLIFMVVYVYEIIVHGIYVFNTTAATIMSVSFIAFSLFYYYLLIKDEAYLLLKKHPPFWWVAGGLLFYFGSTASDLFFSIFKYKTAELYTYRHFTYICLNIILYGFWSYSYICRYHQRKLTR